MSTDRRTLVIDADISRALAGLRQVDDSANRVGASMGRAEASAARAGDTHRRATVSATAESAKLNEQVDKIAGGFGKAGAAVAAMVAGIMAADAAMQKVFTDRAVMTNLPFQIDKARTATMGLVSDMELARQAISAKRLGLPATEEGFARLTEAAMKLGVTSGKTAEEGIAAIVGGLGKGETELLDNVGVTLRAEEAQRAWAEAHNMTVAAMTAEQKSLAVKEIGMQRVLAAADAVTLSVNEQEQAWISARQQWEELVRKTLPELTKKSTGLWQTLDEGGELAQDMAPLVTAALDALGRGLRPIIAYVGFFAKGLAMMGNAVDAFAGAAERAADRVVEFAGGVRDWLSDTWVGDAASWARDTGESILKMADGAMSRLTEEIGEQIPWTKELASEWDIVRRSIVGTDEAMGELFSKPQEKFLDLLGKGKQLGKDTADAEAQRIEGLKNALIYAEHAVNLAEAQKRPAKDLEVLYQNQHMAKVDLLEATGKQAELEQQLRDEAVRQEKALAARRGGNGPTAADRLKAEGEIILNQWQAQLSLMEAEASLLFEETIEFEDVRHNLAVEKLRLEQQVLEAKKGGTAIERMQRDARIELIGAEMELLEKQKARADQAKQLEFDKGAHEQRIAAYDREIERVEHQKSAFQQMQEDREALTEKELEDLGVVDQRLLELQERRNAAALEYANIYQGEEAARQEQHDQEMARIEESKERWKSWDTLRKKQAENEKKRLDAQKQKQKENVQAISGFLGQGQQFAEQVVLAGIKSDAKRERAAMRTNGIMALARAALETVEAVAAFARYDFVAGAAHTAAAVLGSITGFSLLAGRLPNDKGGAGAGGGSAGAGGAANGGKYQTTVADSNSSGPRDRPSTPASAEELTKIRGGYGSATTGGQANSGGGGINIYNSTIVAGDSGSTLHHLDKQQAKRWGT